jgi:hypothetical protein
VVGRDDDRTLSRDELNAFGHDVDRSDEWMCKGAQQVVDLGRHLRETFAVTETEDRPALAHRVSAQDGVRIDDTRIADHFQQMTVVVAVGVSVALV